MNTDWKAFLLEKGALFDGKKLESFRSHESERSTLSESSVVCDLSNQGLIKVHGEDAESFLQNQFTNDIRNVTIDTHQSTAWCSPKGRIIATFRVFKQADCYYLCLSHDLVEHVMKKLRMYVMMSKVTIEDVSKSMIHFGFAGKHVEDTLKEIIEGEGGFIPTETSQTLSYKTSSILLLHSAIPRFEFFGELDDAKVLWDGFANKATQTSSEHWDYLNIRSGLPQISEASSESWIPQMVNYIAIGGVDFQKGCYPGQEIVARLNYLGKTKRRMYRILINTDQLPAINDSIVSENNAAAGKILNVVINPDGKAEALAILKIAEAENKLTLATNNEATITMLDLPYSVDDD